MLFFSILSLLTLLAACGGSTTTSSNSSTPSSSGSKASTCDKSTGLTLYSAQGYDSDAAKAFQQQSGITTKLVDDSTGNILAKIAAEGGNPQWDVAWFDGNVTMQTLDDQGLLLKWHSPNTSNLTSQGAQYVPSDGSYYPTGLTTVGAIAYNTKHVPAAGLPKDWPDLLKPAYKNLVAMNDPAYSGPTYPLIAGVSQILGGENQGKQFFTQLKANGLKIFQTNNPTLNSVETGAREFGIVQDSAIYGAIKAGQPLGIIYPTSGAIGLPGVIGVAANGKHQACAEQFVNWVLSTAGQMVMTHHDPTDGDTYFIPIVNAATIAQNANVTLVTYQIYSAINTSPVNFALAAALSLLLFIAIALALLVQAGILRTRSFQVISGRNRPARPIELGRWKWPVMGFCIVVFLIALVIPLGMCLVLSFLQAFGQGLTSTNWTLSNYQTVLTQGSDDLDALIRTVWLSLGTATITVLVGLPIAFIIRRTSLPGRKLLSLFTLVTIAVPGIILACGYIFAWNAPWLEYIGIGGSQGIQFYGTIWLLFAAYIGGSLPYATRLSIGGLDQIGQGLLETAQVQGASMFQLLIRIVGPLLRSSLVSIWLLVFTGTMFELAASELLYPPGEPTLPVRIVGLFNDFKLGPGMALAMLNIGMVTVALILLRFVPWLVGQLIQRNIRRKTIYVSIGQTIEQELRITTGRF